MLNRIFPTIFAHITCMKHQEDFGAERTRLNIPTHDIQRSDTRSILKTLSQSERKG